MTIEPIGKMILIEAVKIGSGAIVLPALNPVAGPNGTPPDARIWKVVAVGEGRMAADGTIVPIPLEPGDEVVLGIDVRFISFPDVLYGDAKNGRELVMVDFAAVIGKVTGRETNMPPRIMAARMRPAMVGA